MSRRRSPPLLPIPLFEAQCVGDGGVIGEPQLLGEGRSHVGKVLLLRHDQNLQGRHLLYYLHPLLYMLTPVVYLLTPTLANSSW